MKRLVLAFVLCLLLSVCSACQGTMLSETTLMFISGLLQTGGVSHNWFAAGASSDEGVILLSQDNSIVRLPLTLASLPSSASVIEIQITRIENQFRTPFSV